MKFVTIEPVERPANFSNVAFLKADWEKADKIGPKVVPYGTAMENCKNSKGLYRIRPAASEAPVAVNAVKDPFEMSSAELVKEMTAFGKPPQKQMSRKVAAEFVLKLRAEAEALITEDEPDDDTKD